MNRICVQLHYLLVVFINSPHDCETVLFCLVASFLCVYFQFTLVFILNSFKWFRKREIFFSPNVYLNTIHFQNRERKKIIEISLQNKLIGILQITECWMHLFRRGDRLCLLILKNVVVFNLSFSLLLNKIIAFASMRCVFILCVLDWYS